MGSKSHGEFQTHVKNNIKNFSNSAALTESLGLSLSLALQLAQEGVLLGQQDFNVLHTDVHHPRPDVREQRVDALRVSR